ncbi:MAG: undecaprenyl-diphosphate phosphatase [Candidatus Puniceispirillum sp.]
MPLGLLVLVAFIQGITEFLPVSSSGHLVLLPLVSGYAYQGQTIDVAAHVGTLLAVLIYVRREVLAISVAWLGFGRRDPVNGWLGLMLVVATIPVIIAGYFVNYAALDWLDLVQTLAVANLFFAGLLWLADRQPPRRDTLGNMQLRQAVIIGLAQICALVPGTSRSGITMTAARFLGFDRVTSARFSLLLSLPVIAGAGLLKTKDLIEAGDMALGVDALLVVALSAGLALLAIRWMMQWLAKASFTIFVYYRLALGGLLLALLAIGAINPALG